MILIALLITLAALMTLFCLFYISKRVKYLVFGILVCLLFIGIATSDLKIIFDKQTVMAQGSSDDAKINTDAQYSSGYQEEKAATEISILNSYSWNTTIDDIFSSGNLLLIQDVFSNVLTGTIQSGDLYEDISYKQEFQEKIQKEPAKNVGNYFRISMEVSRRGLCEDEKILQAFPQYKGYVVVYDVGTLNENSSVNILSLLYTKNSNAEILLKHMREKSVYNFGIYVGTLEQDNTLYYTFIDYLPGE